jgi:hypothetical protein
MIFFAPIQFPGVPVGGFLKYPLAKSSLLKARRLKWVTMYLVIHVVRTKESGIVNTYEFNRAHFPGAFSF